MIKFTYTLLIAFVVVSCKPSEGSLTGNVFWRYNNYVGDKPDAGSDIYLYKQSKKEKPLNAMADVQGNFRFDKVPTGDYVMIVVSANTDASGEDMYDELDSNAKQIKEIFGYDIPKIKLSKDVFKNYMTVTKAISDTSLIKLGLLTHKFRIKPVKIERDKTVNEVIDFGNTFM